MREVYNVETESYVYKKEVDWSVLMEGFTLPIENQVVFLQNMGRFLQRGESKIIHFLWIIKLDIPEMESFHRPFGFVLSGISASNGKGEKAK